MTEQEEQKVTRATEKIVQAAAWLLARTAFRMIQQDNHHWSERPCGTCQAITGMLGEPFGCNKYALDKASARSKA